MRPRRFFSGGAGAAGAGTDGERGSERETLLKKKVTGTGVGGGKKQTRPKKKSIVSAVGAVVVPKRIATMIPSKKKKFQHRHDDSDDEGSGGNSSRDDDDGSNDDGDDERGQELPPIGVGGRRSKKNSYGVIAQSAADEDEEDGAPNSSDNDGRGARRPRQQQARAGSGGAAAAAKEIPIDDAIEMLGMGTFQFRILVAAGLCFAADSMEILLLSFLAVVLESQWNLSDDQTATITSVVFIGALAGTSILGPLGDRIGRKPVFILTAAIIAVFGFATAAANRYSSLVGFRFMVGFGVGGLTVPFDTLAEFVPTSHRGTNLLAIEYFWTLGTLTVPILAYFSLGDGSNDDDKNAWRLFVVLCAIPCLLSTLVGIVFVPESPRWLLTKGRHDQALAILRDAATSNRKNPLTVFPDGTKLIDEEDELGTSTSCLNLLKPKWRRTTLFLFSAWAGFAFTYYATIMVVTLVFSTEQPEDGGAADDEKSTGGYSFDYVAIFTSASSEVAGVTLVMLVIDRVGRIPTQTVCYVLGGISVCTLSILASQEASRNSLVAMAFLSRLFFMGSTCATWVSTAEIFTTEIRATGHAASNAIARVAGSLSPYLVTESTSFLVIGPVLLAISLATAYSTWNLPETAGRRMGGTSTQCPRQPVQEVETVQVHASYAVV